MWSGPLLVAALVSFGAGVSKLVSPSGASAALRTIGIRAQPTLVRVGATLESFVAGAAVVTAAAWTRWLLAASYVGFSAFVAVLGRRPAVLSCGCFGGEGAAPSKRHVVVNTALAVLVACAAATSAPSLRAVLEHQPLTGVPFVVVALSTAWLVYLLLAASSRPFPMRQMTVNR